MVIDGGVDAQISQRLQTVGSISNSIAIRVNNTSSSFVQTEPHNMVNTPLS
jgi:hypothetical protein